MITHLIEEAVFLADRIVIMGTMPGHIRQILPNALPHPREYQSPSFQKMVQQIHQIIVSEHMPDEPSRRANRGNRAEHRADSLRRLGPGHRAHGNRAGPQRPGRRLYARKTDRRRVRPTLALVMAGRNARLPRHAEAKSCS